MKFKFRNTRVAVVGLALLMVDAGPVLGATIALNGATGNSCSYTTYSADSSGNLQVACGGDSQPPPGGTPVCSLAASPSTINTGESSQLTASCSNSPASYTWTGSGTANFTSSTSSGPVSPTSTTTYTVKGSNNAGAGNTASTTVTLQSNQNPGDWVVPTNCKIIPVTWKGNLDLITGNGTPKQTMRNGQMIAFSMKVPPTTQYSTQAQTAYADVSKYMSISKNACEFSERLGTSALGVNSCMKGGRPNVMIWKGGEGQQGDYCHLPNEGETVYFNVRNGTSPTSADSCPAGKDCSFYFSW